MAAITVGTVRIYKTAGTSQQEKRLMIGPVSVTELAFLFDSSSGYRFRIDNGFDMPEDAVMSITLVSAQVAVNTVAGINLQMSGKIFYQGLDKNVILEGRLGSSDTGVTLYSNTATIETEILKFQVPKGSTWAFRKNDWIYLALATA